MIKSMIQLVKKTPTKVYVEGSLSGLQRKALEHELTYRDKSKQFELKRLENQLRFSGGARQDYLRNEIEELRPKVTNCLLFTDETGTWTHSGLASRVLKYLRCGLLDLVSYPEPKPISWTKIPEYKMYPYQEASVEKLLEAKHAGVELATGLGKTLCLLHIARNLGLKTVVMTPSSNISEQIYDLFVTHLGKKNVGKFWGGKKESEKLIVVGNGQSFTRIKENSKEWKDLGTTRCFLSDESHVTPAETFRSVCSGIFANAAYRFFFSATQIRNDGLDLLLEGITGPMVHRMTAKEGMDQGYLAKTFFKAVSVRSESAFVSQDANEMTRKHLYYNPDVILKAAAIANAAVATQKHSVLILIDELEQFAKLWPLLKFETRFAHGGSITEKIPVQFHDSDPAALVKAFNEQRFPILVGTSCISTGTDIKAVQTMIYLKGGKSRIEVMQSVGRCTRLMPSIGKKECNVFDFVVENIDVLRKHGEARIKIFEDINDPVKRLQW